MRLKNRDSCSVIIPAHNAAATLGRCLDSVFAQAGEGVEVIVVDDGSTDATREVASRYPIRLVQLAECAGAPGARNCGVSAARSSVLFFIDADVELHSGALARGLSDLAAPGVDAVIGSYDDDPDVKTTVSQYKNLAHHYFHQRSGPWTTVFWGACGVIKRDVFMAAGGFRETPRVLEVEDSGLGYRLTSIGARIELDPALQVKHLKRWTFNSLLATDTIRRAIPFTLLLLRYGRFPRGLNFTWSQRLATLVTLSLIVILISAITQPMVLLGAVPMIAVTTWINLDLYRLFYRRGGLRLLVGGFSLQQLYYLYSAAGFLAGLAVYFWTRPAGLEKYTQRQAADNLPRPKQSD